MAEYSSRQGPDGRRWECPCSSSDKGWTTKTALTPGIERIQVEIFDSQTDSIIGTKTIFANVPQWRIGTFSSLGHLPSASTRSRACPSGGDRRQRRQADVHALHPRRKAPQHRQTSRRPLTHHPAHGCAYAQGRRCLSPQVVIVPEEVSKVRALCSAVTVANIKRIVRQIRQSRD